MSVYARPYMIGHSQPSYLYRAILRPAGSASTGLELNGPVVNFKKVTFSPADPAMLACVHNDGTFYLINLDETRGVMSEAESRRAIFASPSHPIGQVREACLLRLSARNLTDTQVC